MAVQEILPDPNNKIDAAGDVDSSGSAGPGFKSVTLKSEQKIMRDRTNSGRVITRSHAYHKWIVDITYNSLTKAEFHPVYAFLLEKQGSLKPFFVELPQYRSQGPSDKTTDAAADAGKYTLSLNNVTDVEVGDLFRITDSSNTDHTKAYMVTRVDSTNSDITITPALAKAVTNGATVDFTNPTIKVVQTSDIQQYSLNAENLYNFKLSLEEAQY